MTTTKNAASVAVKAAACANQPAANPRDVLDCIAMGIPREDWEASLDNDEAQAWSVWLAQGETAQTQPCKEDGSQLVSDGYSHAQLVMMLESIATQMAALNGLLQMAQTCDEDWQSARLLDAAQAMTQGIGSLADGATGGEIFGGIGRWHCGPFFDDAGKQGGAA